MLLVSVPVMHYKLRKQVILADIELLTSYSA